MSMAAGRLGTVVRIVKPIVAGLALAYLLTAFVDKPAPVHFQPENPYAAQQAAIVKTHAELVVEKNVMKLGSPLSVAPEDEMSSENPLARLEELDNAASDNATAESDSGNATSTVRGNIEALPEQP